MVENSGARLPRDILKQLNNCKIPLQKKRMNVKTNSSDTFHACILGKVSFLRKGRMCLEDSLVTKANPSLTQLIFDYGKSIQPGFGFNAVCVNKSYQMRKHKDKNNIGESMVVGLGDYSGGELKIWNKKGDSCINYDIKQTPIVFNGSQFFHEVAAFEGERWSLVYYTMKLALREDIVIAVDSHGANGANEANALKFLSENLIPRQLIHIFVDDHKQYNEYKNILNTDYYKYITIKKQEDISRSFPSNRRVVTMNIDTTSIDFEGDSLLEYFYDTFYECKQKSNPYRINYI